MLGWFAETTVMASALAAVAALAGRTRSIGPTARHVLWLSVMIRLVTPPLVAWPWAVAWPDRGVPAPAVRTATIADAPAAVGEADVDVAAAVESTPRPVVTLDRLEGPILAGWLAATLLLSGVQGCRIVRFGRRLRWAVPAPDDLVAEAARMADRIGVRAPGIVVIPGSGSPMLWCLGRPRLLIPAELVGVIGMDRWRGILAHELAHLRRCDHWVSRLELVAGLLWWWNPVYWLARARIGAEAELACDAWVVWALPGDRLAYAEALFAVGSRSSRAGSPAPALGAAGRGRFLERRLTMILREKVPCRLSPWVVLSAVVLVGLAMPSWSATTPTAGPPKVVVVDPDDGDQDEAAASRAEAALKRAEAALERAEAAAKQAESKPRPRPEPRPDPKPGAEGPKKPLAPEETEKLKAELQERMERLGKEMESKFGPGSEFQEKMERLGKEMESKFGPGSDFEKQMRKFGEDMEKQLGPGSSFEKSMREMAERLKQKAIDSARVGAELESIKKLEDRADWARRMHEKGYVSKGQLDADEARLKQAQARDQAEKKRAEAKAPAEKKSEARAESKDRRRSARIAALRQRIRELDAQLKELEDDDGKDRR